MGVGLGFGGGGCGCKMEWLGMAPIEQALIRAGGQGWKVGDWKETGVRLLCGYDSEDL